MQAMYFQSVFRREGSQRGYAFDAAYKEVFDAAMALPNRPIYLVDGTSPAYVHAYWYATVEGRNRAELIHMEVGIRPPMGALVISSEANCANCQVIKRSGDYILYDHLARSDTNRDDLSRQHATTQVAPEVFDAMRPFLRELYGNPSSAHEFGRRTRAALEHARAQVAELLRAGDSSEIVFTSGDQNPITGRLAVFSSRTLRASYHHDARRA